MLKAAFPGSFDPLTLGHVNIIQRAAAIFDELVVVVAQNHLKKHLFSAEERASMINELALEWKNVSVAICDVLIVDFLHKNDIKLLVRGVRGTNDFSYEFDLSMINKSLAPGIETVFLATDPDYFVLRSSNIKELASFGADLGGLVPNHVARALKEKYQQNR